MKLFYITLLFICLLITQSAHSGSHEEASIIGKPKNPTSRLDSASIEKLEIEIKEIKVLYKRLNILIEKIDTTFEQIKSLIENKDDYINCLMQEHLNNDIKELKKLINKNKNKLKHEQRLEKLKHFETIYRNLSKKKNNFKCQ